MAREDRRVRIGARETRTVTIPEDSSEEEEAPLSAEELQALREWEQEARQEREEDRGLSTRQHALLALGRAAAWRARVEAYTREPSLPQLADRTLKNNVPQEGRQHVPVPPPARVRRAAPRARQWIGNVEENSMQPQLPDVQAQRVRRPAPKARQHVPIQPVEAAQHVRSDEETYTDRFDGSQDLPRHLPTISLTRGSADVSVSR
eukprot:TRINITY_DN26448_c0_g1_i1.p1 TRINITY_DN26448_c0_g1~~TRINITY_DN26448_c0_g1_i1.p1  ORF type:complete len:205 (+),score=22.41 TRINITY_DN26448_c0_g1_i1:32-646(+)